MDAGFPQGARRGHVRPPMRGRPHPPKYMTKNQESKERRMLAPAHRPHAADGVAAAVRHGPKQGRKKGRPGPPFRGL